MTIVIAPTAFKGSLTALEAAAVMAAAAATVFPERTLVPRPMADGGDGSVDCLLTAGFDPITVPARGPTGTWHEATIAMQGTAAVVELANTCGLLLLPDGRLSPTASHTRGLGDALLAAIFAGADDIVLCVGGSASTDGGSGLLTALGVRLLDADDREVPPGGQWLQAIARVDLSGLDPRLRDVRLRVATDVDSPLFGPQGAAFVFGPQKGAGPEDIAWLDRGLRHWAELLENATGVDAADRAGAGAAGGTAFAAMCALGAGVVSGAEYIADAIGLREAVASADLVITGEGSLDHQSLQGKGAVHVARIAEQAGTPCVMVCGRVDLTREQLSALGLASWGSAADLQPNLDLAMKDAVPLLTRRTIGLLADLR